MVLRFTHGVVRSLRARREWGVSERSDQQKELEMIFYLDYIGCFFHLLTFIIYLLYLIYLYLKDILFPSIIYLYYLGLPLHLLSYSLRSLCRSRSSSVRISTTGEQP